MFLEEIIIQNFRGYEGQCRIKINNFTAFIGENDIGKSTIFDALNIFFNDSANKMIDSTDFCVRLKDSTKKEVVIGCVFSDLPDELIIDSQAETNLRDEYLLREDGKLEIHKVYDFSNAKKPSPKIFIIANHPTANGYDDLLNKKHPELEKIVEGKNIKNEVSDLKSNVALRKAIWDSCDDLELQSTEIQIDKVDKESPTKKWDKISSLLPMYEVFQVDRPSTDQDDEIQNPLNSAIKIALAEVERELSSISERVIDKTKEIANATIEELKEINPNLAKELSPDLKAPPKWESVFKLSMTGDDEIPINKRGSGVRRLILFSFFKAYAKQKRDETQSQGQGASRDIIYAIEEPETSLHPNHQKMLIESFMELSETDKNQVMITTHVPGIVLDLALENIRYVHWSDKIRIVKKASDDDAGIMKKIISTLGIMPDGTASVVLCMEGPSDIEFIKNISQKMASIDGSVIDISNNKRIAFATLGGGTVKQWVNNNYLENLKVIEFHIYDRDELQSNGQCKYQDLIDKVKSRDDASSGTLTQRREIENYLTLDLIKKAFGHEYFKELDFEITDDCKVVKEIEKSLKEKMNMSDDVIKGINIKKKLSNALKEVALDDLRNNGGYDEVRGWLQEITKLVENNFA